MGLAVPFAFLAGYFIYQYGGPMASWSTSAGLMTLALLYAIFFVKESVVIEDNDTVALKAAWMKNEDEKEGRCCNALGVFKNLFHCVAVTIKPRPGFQRSCILLLLFAAFLGHFTKGIFF